MTDTQGFVPWNVAELIATGKKSIRFKSRLNGRIFSFALIGYDLVYSFVEVVSPEPKLETRHIYEGISEAEVKQAILTAVMQA